MKVDAMLVSRIWWLPACLLLTACPPNPQDGGVFKVDVVLPSGSHVVMTCAPIINYNSSSVRISGIDIPISKAAGIDIKVGEVGLDQTTLRQASDLIEVLDNAQFQYCRILPFVAPQDVYKLWQDANTQQIALTTLLRNLAGAQNQNDARAAIATAANTASTAASSPSTPAAVIAAPPSTPVASTPPALPSPAAPAGPAALVAPVPPPAASVAAGPTNLTTTPAGTADAAKAAATLQAAASAAKSPGP